MPTLETVPALRISYAHRILSELYARGAITLEKLFAEVDPEELFKSPREHRAPEDRAKQVILFSRRLGLIGPGAAPIELTELGRRYVAAMDPSSVWDVTQAQATLLREVFVDSYQSDGMLWGAALTLGLAATAPSDESPSREDFGRALADAGGAEGWQRPRTYESQGSRFLMLLQDMHALDAANRPTELGHRLLEQISLPADLDFQAALEGNSRRGDGGAWIFQANPRFYDIRGALSALEQMNWTTAQYADEIRAGDRVYLWESGPQGGLVARGKILTDPAPMPEQEGLTFIRDESKFEGEQIRSRLSVEDVLSSPVDRAMLSGHPVLKDLQILRFANATNFKVTPEQQDALDELFDGDDAEDLLRPLVEKILDTYATARASEPFGSSSPVWGRFEALANAINGARPVARRSTLKATWSAGRGNWARVPWIALLDSRETVTTQRGVYPALLFRQDLTGVYLTLAQGVTEPKKLGRAEAVAYLQGVAQRVRSDSAELRPAGFSLDGDIDLRADPGLGKDYEVSTIAHKLYEGGAVPPDRDLLADLEAVLMTYDRYIEAGDRPEGLLGELVEAFRRERPYPTDKDKTQVATREELAGTLSPDALEAIEAVPARWDELRFTHFAGQAYGGPGPQSRIHRAVLDGGDDAKRRVARALRHVLYGRGRDEAGRIDDVLEDPEWAVYGLGESLIVKALATVYPGTWLPVFQYAGSMGKKRLAQSPALGVEPLDEEEFATRGARAVESNRRLREVLEPLFPDDPWAQGQFLYWLRDRVAAEQPPRLGLVGLADELLLDRDWLQETVELLRDKRQLILYGPPGTGKTYVARKLAEFVSQEASRAAVVQFHPSYAYEDFVEGYRPVHDERGGVRFELRPGPLRRLAEAAEESEADWCLLIDEINRGNIPKIFGELYYLLEYRGDEIELQYGGGFSLPKNLYIIGTMNTADRSIALLDAALRRRFHFVPFFPDRPPVAGLLRRWLEQKRPGMEYVADLVERANALLPDRHLQIGPSHFMTLRLDDEWLEKIWRGSVMPYIEEQFFDEPERVQDFALDALRDGASGSSNNEEAHAEPDAPAAAPNRVADDDS